MKCFQLSRRLISLINIIAILLMSYACNFNNSISIDKGLENVIKLLENQGEQSQKLLIIANEIKESHKKSFANIEYKERLVGVFNNNEKETAEQWMRDNEKTISIVLSRISSKIENDIGEINNLSKNAYLDHDKKSSLWKYVLTYFRLQYLRNDLRKSMITLSPLTFIIHSPALEEDTKSLELRKNLEVTLLKMVGVGVVIDQDFNQVKKILKSFKETIQIPEELRSILVKTEEDVIKEMNKQNKKFKLSKDECVFQSENTNVEECQKILETRERIKSQYEKITFLFTPGQKYFLATKVLSLVGNLTWGLANTLIGAGVVLTAMAVSPFTEYINFPTFHLSQSGMQIYVDVTGMSPIPGKVSLGLFELDNASGFSFSSYHEGGHAIQSAILGPFYLPAVLITYVVSGFDSGLMENLADMAASASDKWL